MLETNFRYYEPRTGHGSSLSPGTHAALAARIGDLSTAERYFSQTVAIDLDDRMGNAAGGIHMAAQGSLWQASVFGYGGVEWRDDALSIAPRLPPGSWQRMEIPLQWRGRRLHVSCDARTSETSVDLLGGASLTTRSPDGTNLTLLAGSQLRRPTESQWELREERT